MLHTDKQLCLLPSELNSATVSSICLTEVWVVAINRLRVAGVTSHHREAAPESHTTFICWQCAELWSRQRAGGSWDQAIVKVSNCSRRLPQVEDPVELSHWNSRAIIRVFIEFFLFLFFVRFLFWGDLNFCFFCCVFFLILLNVFVNICFLGLFWLFCCLWRHKIFWSFYGSLVCCFFCKGNLGFFWGCSDDDLAVAVSFRIFRMF